QLYNLAIFKGKFENRRFSFNNLAEPEPIRHSSFFGSGSAGWDTSYQKIKNFNS
ncbi:MAG: hypothetical protein SCARUB_05131, partial [Candidatus Scalindua rubra]